MNIKQLDLLIQSCIDKGDNDLVKYYLKKRKQLVKEITKNINEALAVQ